MPWMLGSVISINNPSLRYTSLSAFNVVKTTSTVAISSIDKKQ